MVENKRSMLEDVRKNSFVQDCNRLKVQNIVEGYFRLNLKIMLDIELGNDDLD